MSELSIVARKLVEEAKALNAEIDAFDDPPSRTQIEALQDVLNELQHRLNRIQVETDAWAEEKEAVELALNVPAAGTSSASGW